MTIRKNHTKTPTKGLTTIVNRRQLPQGMMAGVGGRLGNCNGAFKTGRFTQLNGKRPINALYASILRASGVNVDRVNMSEQMAAKYDSGTGPLREILA